MIDWPIFVLSLPSEVDRRAPLLDRLRQSRLPFELFMGIDDRSGLQPRYQSIIDRTDARRRMGRDMSGGEIACALSHRATHDRIQQDDLPGAVVLEGDAMPESDFPNFFRSQDYASVPMVLLDHAFGRALPLLRKRRSAGGVLRRAVQGTVTAAYTVRRDAAARLLRSTHSLDDPADWQVALYGPGACARAADKGRVGARKRSLSARFRSRTSVRVGRQKGAR